jgi:CubicO group peptidase (beta-lactamase class C family)
MLANGGELDGVRLLKPQTVALMFQDHLPAAAAGKEMMPGVQFQFGYGFAIGNASTARAGLFPPGAVGWDGSGNTFFWVDPGKKRVTVFMTQVITPKGPPAPLKKLVYEAVYDDGDAAKSLERACD